MLAIGSFLQMLMAIWFVMFKLDVGSAPHMVWNAIATPFACLLAVAWTGMRLTGIAGAHTAGGFALCGLALAARAECELFMWVGGPPVETMTGVEVASPALLDLVRHTATVTYVAGLAVVVSSVWMSARKVSYRALLRRPVALAAAGLLVAFFVLYVWLLVEHGAPLLRP